MPWVKDCRNFGRTGGWFAETWATWPDGRRQLLAIQQEAAAQLGTGRRSSNEVESHARTIEV